MISRKFLTLLLPAMFVLTLNACSSERTREEDIRLIESVAIPQCKKGIEIASDIYKVEIEEKIANAICHCQSEKMIEGGDVKQIAEYAEQDSKGDPEFEKLVEETMVECMIKFNPNMF